MKRLLIFFCVALFFVSSITSFAVEPEELPADPVEDWEYYSFVTFDLSDNSVSDDRWYNGFDEFAAVSNTHDSFKQFNSRGDNFRISLSDFSGTGKYGMYGLFWTAGPNRNIAAILVSDQPFTCSYNLVTFGGSPQSYTASSTFAATGKYFAVLGQTTWQFSYSYFDSFRGYFSPMTYSKFVEQFVSNDGSGITFPELDPDEFEYSSELGYLVGFDSRSKIYKIETYLNESYDIFNPEINEITFRTGWNNKTSSGLDLWRNSFSNVRIQPVIHVRSFASDILGNIVETKNEYLEQPEIPVEQVTYSYSTTGLMLDFPNIFNFTQPAKTVRYNFEVYFRILADKDGISYRGDWVSVSPDWSGIYSGITPTVSITPGDYVPGIGFRPGIGGTTSPIPVGTGSNPDEADNDIIDQLPEDVETPDFTNLLKSLTTLISQIGSIPSIISSVFSFLPGWCLLLAASSFGLMCLLMIYKLIRG